MADVVFQFDPMRVGRERHEIEAWLQRAGVNPCNVPTDARVVFSSDDTMTIDVFLLNADGSKYVIEDTVARGAATVPLIPPRPLFESLVAIPAVPAGEPTPDVTG
jgi:hypothetical protein